jgi:hypothetical protein
VISMGYTPNLTDDSIPSGEVAFNNIKDTLGPNNNNEVNIAEYTKAMYGDISQTDYNVGSYRGKNLPGPQISVNVVNPVQNYVTYEGGASTSLAIGTPFYITKRFNRYYNVASTQITLTQQSVFPYTAQNVSVNGVVYPVQVQGANVVVQSSAQVANNANIPVSIVAQKKSGKQSVIYQTIADASQQTTQVPITVQLTSSVAPNQLTTPYHTPYHKNDPAIHHNNHHHNHNRHAYHHGYAYQAPQIRKPLNHNQTNHQTPHGSQHHESYGHQHNHNGQVIGNAVNQAANQQAPQGRHENAYHQGQHYQQHFVAQEHNTPAKHQNGTHYGTHVNQYATTTAQLSYVGETSALPNLQFSTVFDAASTCQDGSSFKASAPCVTAYRVILKPSWTSTTYQSTNAGTTHQLPAMINTQNYIGDTVV